MTVISCINNTTIVFSVMQRFAIFFLLLQCGISQERNFRQYTVEDGLSQNSIYGITQDSSGFLWFTTADGVNRFDGYSFTVFRPIPIDRNSIPSTFTRDVVLSPNGFLWFTHDIGLSSYHLQSNSFCTIPVKIGGDRQVNIQSIVIDAQQQVWCTTLSEIFRMNDHDSSFTKIPLLSTDGTELDPIHIQSLFSDAHNELWAGTKKGIFKFDPVQSSFIPFSPLTFGEVDARSFFEDTDGRIWIGTSNNGLFSLSGDRNSITQYSAAVNGSLLVAMNNLTSLVVDRSGIVWLGTYENGLFSFDPKTKSLLQFKHDPSNTSSIGFDIIRTLYLDNNDNLWIGTDGGGVSVTHLFPKQFHLITQRQGKKYSLSDNFVKGIYQDAKGFIWIGTSSGLNRHDARNGVTTLYRPYPDEKNAAGNLVLKISEGNAGTLLLATANGISSFATRTQTFKHFSGLSAITGYSRSQVSNYVRHNDSILCLATFGVVTFNAKTGHYALPYSVSEKFKNMLVTFVLWDSNGRLWVSTFFDGLFSYDSSKNEWKKYTPVDNDVTSISSTGIRGIFEESPGILWIGTTNGLNRYEKSSDSFTRYFEKDGLPSAFVYGILPDEHGNLWLSTNKGLSKFNPKKNTFRNYSVQDGLQSSEFNTGAFFRNPRNGMLFFGGIGGVTYFHPDSIIDSPFSPPIVLTEFKIFDQLAEQPLAFPFTNEIELPYDQNTLTFSFAAMDFSNPRQVKYFYRLEGFEETWIEAGSRRDVRYTNLSDGEYTFRVRATNADGVIGKHELEIHVVIVPPIWKRWWFISLSIILAVGMIGVMIRLYFARRIRKQVELYRREKEILEERMKTRDQIARDLHDDLASTVGSAGLYIETAKRTLGHDSALTKEYLDKTSSILNEAEEAMSDIVWSVSPKHDTLHSLATRIRLVTTDLCRANGIGSTIDVKGNIDIPLSDEIRRGVYLIFKEVLNNCVKHSHASLVEVCIGIENDRLVFRITDDGIGFSMNTATEKLGGNGMHNIRKRSEEIGAHITINSIAGKGTTIVVEKQMTQLSH